LGKHKHSGKRTKVHNTFSFNAGGIAVGKLVVRFEISISLFVLEIFTDKVWNRAKSGQI